MAKQYLTDPHGPQHFIGNRIVEPGSVVTLPKGVTPGLYLTEITAKEAAELEAAAAEDAAEGDGI